MSALAYERPDPSSCSVEYLSLRPSSLTVLSVGSISPTSAASPRPAFDQHQTWPRTSPSSSR
eukprot:1969819-Prymnesium_polylepis.1